jgi:hypothetical protein
MTSTNYTQDRLSYLEKAASLVAAVANSTDKNSGSNNVSSSNNRSEATNTVQITRMTGRNDTVNVNRSAEVNPPLKNHGLEGSVESSNSSFSPKDKRRTSSTEKKPSVARHQNTKDKNQDKMKRKALAVSSESSYGTSSVPKASIGELYKRQKYQDDDTAEEDGEHDLTTPEGQMAMNPKLTAKAAATEAKREYNRRNAARARKRNKSMVGGLQEKIHSLTKRTEDLQNSNEMLTAQLEVLQTQNRVLLVNSKDTEPKAQVEVQSSSSNDILSQLLERLQGNSEAQQKQKQHQPKQQGQDIIQLLSSLNGQGGSSQHLNSLQQGGQQAGGNILASMQGQGNAQLLSALLGQSQAQQQLPRQEQNTNSQTGMQGQSMSQLLSTFGFQGQQQQRNQQQQHGSSSATQDQHHLQELLSSMPPEALYNMLRKSSRGEGRQ